MRYNEDGVKPWDRQKGESSEMYSYFLSYLNSEPPRNLKDIAKQYDKTLKYIFKVSNNWSWEDRVTKYNIHIQKELTELREEMFYNHISELIKQEIQVSKELEKNISLLNEKQESDDKYAPITVSNLLLNHEKVMSEHIHNFYLLCGKPDKVESVQGEPIEYPVIHNYQTGKELMRKLHKLDDGSAEDNIECSGEDNK